MCLQAFMPNQFDSHKICWVNSKGNVTAASEMWLIYVKCAVDEKESANNQ